jgi:hypothetical protein
MVTRKNLIRMGESILTKKQVALARQLADTDPESEEHWTLCCRVDALDQQTAISVLLLEGDYRSEKEDALVSDTSPD